MKSSSKICVQSFRLCLVALLLGFALIACGDNRELGDSPLLESASGILPDQLNGLDSNATWEKGQLRLMVNPAVLKANLEDQAEVRVLLYDDSHNPVVGRTIRFAATRGVIGANAVTDSSGMAKVTYTSEPINEDVWIVASYKADGETITVGKTLRLQGVTLSLHSKATDVLVQGKAEFELELLDASGNPLSDQVVSLSNASQKTIKTNGAGKALFTATLAKQDSLLVSAKALGASANSLVRFWNKIPQNTAMTVEVSRNMRLFSSRSQLRADNSDRATITVILTDERNNPAVGDTVYFASNLGVIGSFGLVDSSGRATVTLQSAPVVGVCKVSARANRGAVQDSLSLDFTGLSLLLQSSLGEAKVGDYVEIDAAVLDASANAIRGDLIAFAVEGGEFENGEATWTTSLDGNGKAKARLTSANAGKVIVRASALNAKDSLTVTFTRNNLTLTAERAYVLAGGGDSVSVTASYLDPSGSPLSGKVLQFYTNAGLIGPKATTDAAGNARVVFKGPEFSGTATLGVVAPNGTANTTIEIRSRSAQRIQISLSPDNIGVNGGESELIAKVFDSLGNLVSGTPVNFRLLKGPGAGEYITKLMMPTQNGIAKSSIKAGAVPSQYKGVLVVADLGNGVADTSKLTISGLPAIVTVARPEDDTVVVQDAGQLDKSVFRYNVGAVVQDINGNPVADGTEVHFSAFVSGMIVHSLYLKEWSDDANSSTIKAILSYRNVDIPFEDINNNYRMDPSIDLKVDFNNAVARRGDDANGDGVVDYDPTVYDYWVDFNGNGICDPGQGEPQYDTGSSPRIYADLDRNGVFTPSELKIDHNGNGLCDLPSSGDFRYWLWEMLPHWNGVAFPFDQNDYAVVIAVSATTQDGVAQAALTYPRQMARRLIVSVGAEANGVHDRNGERFGLPVIVGQ